MNEKEMQILEIDAALEALQGTQSAYQIVGTILVEKKTSQLIEQLQKRKEELQK